MAASFTKPYGVPLIFVTTLILLLQSTSMAEYEGLSLQPNNTVAKLDLRKTRDLMESCVEMYLGPLPPDLDYDEQLRDYSYVKLSDDQCNRVILNAIISIKFEGELTQEHISEIEDVPNHDHHEIRLPILLNFEPADPLRILSKYERAIFRSAMRSCVESILDPPLGLRNSTENQSYIYMSKIHWCEKLFQKIESSYFEEDKLTSLKVQEVLIHILQKIELIMNITPTLFLEETVSLKSN